MAGMYRTDDAPLAKFIRKEIHKHRRSTSILKFQLPFDLSPPTKADETVHSNHGGLVTTLQGRPEVLTQILGHLRDDPKTLAACSMVSRIWCAASSRILFLALRIHRVPHGPSSNLLHSFCRLMDSPRLTAVIRELSFDAPSREDIAGVFTLGLLQHVLVHLPTLHTLRIITFPGTVSKVPGTTERMPLLRLCSLELPASLCLAVRPSFLAHILRMFDQVTILTFHGEDPSYDKLREAGTLTGLCCPAKDIPTRVESVRFNTPGGPLCSTFIIGILHLALDFSALKHLSITLPDLPKHLVDAVEKFCERQEVLTILDLKFRCLNESPTSQQVPICHGLLRKIRYSSLSSTLADTGVRS